LPGFFVFTGFGWTLRSVLPRSILWRSVPLEKIRCVFARTGGTGRVLTGRVLAGGVDITGGTAITGGTGRFAVGALNRVTLKRVIFKRVSFNRRPFKQGFFGPALRPVLRLITSILRLLIFGLIITGVPIIGLPIFGFLFYRSVHLSGAICF